MTDLQKSTEKNSRKTTFHNMNTTLSITSKPLKVISLPYDICHGGDFIVEFKGKYFKTHLQAPLSQPLPVEEVLSLLQLRQKEKIEKVGKQVIQNNQDTIIHQDTNLHFPNTTKNKVNETSSRQQYNYEDYEDVDVFVKSQNQNKERHISHYRSGNTNSNNKNKSLLYKPGRNEKHVMRSKTPPLSYQKSSKTNQKNTGKNSQQKIQAKPKSESNPTSSDSYTGGGGYGCFSGKSSILLANGETKLVEEVQVGDIIQTDSGNAAKIEGIYIQQPCSWDFELYQIDKLIISPPHLIKMNGKWVKPRDISKSVPVKKSIPLYNFVTEGRQGIIVENMILSSVGQFCEGYHDYSKKIVHKLWASQNIVDLLKEHPQWPLIQFPPNCMFFKDFKDPIIVKNLLENKEHSKISRPVNIFSRYHNDLVEIED